MTRPLPGITFHTGTPGIAGGLPRMDVAAFVGFAASGPLDIPVFIEDFARFEEIFGGDVLLAKGEKDGRSHIGHLASAVRAFFRNGGKACYVVRVASDDAVKGRFLLPGMAEVENGTDSLRPAWLVARSEGAWSDGVRVGTQLHEEPLLGAKVREVDGRLEVMLSHRGTPPFGEGDLVRGVWANDAIRFYLFVEAVDALDERILESTPGIVPRVVLKGKEMWFRTVDLSPLGPGNDPLVAEIATILPSSSSDVTFAARWLLPREPGGSHTLLVPRDVGAHVGSVIRLIPAEGEWAGKLLVAGVTRLRPATHQELAGVAALGIDHWYSLQLNEVLAPMEADTARGTMLSGGESGADETVKCARLTFDLWARDGEGRSFALERLAFSPRHPRYVGHLPLDEVLFRKDPSTTPAADGTPHEHVLWEEAAHPRFPLAAPGEHHANLLPLGMERTQRFETASGRYVEWHKTDPPAAVRSGLAQFGPDLFLDPDLGRLSWSTLKEAAFHKTFVQGRPLQKLHALFPIEDVTLIAIPDAIHPPWQRVSPQPVESPLAPPVLTSVEVAPTGGTVRVHWTSVEGAQAYVLEEGADPLFTFKTTQRRLDGTRASWIQEEECPSVRYFRVRAERAGDVSPWSNTVAVRLPDRPFAGCDERIIPAPELSDPEELGDGYIALTWTDVGSGWDDATYVLEQAQDPQFQSARIVYRGNVPNATFFVAHFARADRPEVGYFRVRAMVQGQSSPWSNSVVLIPLNGGNGESEWVAAERAEPETLRTLHEAMLHLCAARKDMTCLLCLPQGYDTEETTEYVHSLLSRFRGRDEEVPAYGALYYPGLWVSHRERPTGWMPPDGAVAGQIARQSLRHGAWVAPANVTLHDGLALEPEVENGDASRLHALGVNLLVHRPRGIVVMGASTLVGDERVRPLSVQRLLILIRKLALREGRELVFEPNDALLRRRLRRRFEGVLAGLFEQGAFTGSRPEEAYRVVVEEEAAVRRSAELGQVVTELWFAPSRPLEFIKVRLVQSERDGTRLFVM